MRAPASTSRTQGTDAKSIWALVLIVGLGSIDHAGGAEMASKILATAASARHGFESMRTQFEAMSETDVKTFYTHCSTASIERRLDGGEAMACSLGYDVLLKKHFDGDFERLLDWSRRQPR